ncbi:MAG: methyl-accepting chemotaxis protein [Oscillospiraceae bacterium]
MMNELSAEKTENRPSHQTTALDDYINRVYRLILLLIPGACQCAGLVYTFEKIAGWLPTVSWTALVIFDITCLIYLAFGLYLVRTGISDGVVKPSKLKVGKIYILVLMLIQYNFILHMIPATDFWGFAFFFVLLSAFMLDTKLIAAVSAEIAGSLAVSWIFFNDHTLPTNDDMFLPNLFDRIIAVALSLPTLVLLVFLISRFLVNAKKDELQRNNERVQNVLRSVQELSGRMLEAGTALSGISSSETASAEELSSTSDGLLVSSNALRQKAGESMKNLNELTESGEKLSANVRKVSETSDEVMKKSEENENVLNSLKSVNSEVIRSMEETNEVVSRLSEAVKGIDAALNLINGIAMQTNILSLNASIEAARAGSAGKGFAVVAHEVGNLAKSTSDSLSDIQTVIARVQDNVSSMTAYVSENNKKLELQNEYFDEVFRNMQEMNGLLRQSMEEISAMNSVHERQSQIIGHTYEISADIAESIENENKEFRTISDMVDNNAKDALLIEKQVASINEMTIQIDELLK